MPIGLFAFSGNRTIAVGGFTNVLDYQHRASPLGHGTSILNLASDFEESDRNPGQKVSGWWLMFSIL